MIDKKIEISKKNIVAFVKISGLYTFFILILYIAISLLRNNVFELLPRDNRLYAAIPFAFALIVQIFILFYESNKIKTRSENAQVPGELLRYNRFEFVIGFVIVMALSIVICKFVFISVNYYAEMKIFDSIDLIFMANITAISMFLSGFVLIYRELGRSAPESLNEGLEK